jgi:hypothetical protein
MGEKKNAYRILLGDPEEKRPLERPTRRLGYNIKMNVKYDGVIWPGFIWLRLESSGVLM